MTGNEPLSILPLSAQPEERSATGHYKLCDRLNLEKKQRRMCRRDPGVAETLMEAISMSALECQYQFRFERWNCSLEARYRAHILKREQLHPEDVNQQESNSVCRFDIMRREQGRSTTTDVQRAVVSSMSHPVSAAPSADGCTMQDYMHTDRYHDCP
ncbi:hypothetical protein NFI96_026012 [Prochilodus magdalenae]|nr:hypothetical protein NFI96_026012 [Prochilodus magdalenae]